MVGGDHLIVVLAIPCVRGLFVMLYIWGGGEMMVLEKGGDYS